MVIGIDSDIKFSDFLSGFPNKIENERPSEISLEPIPKLRKKEYKKKLEESIEFRIDLDLDIYHPGLKIGNNLPHDDTDPVYIEPDNWGPEDWPNYHDRCASYKCSKFLYHVGSYYEGVKVYNFDGDGVCKLFCIECWKKITIDHQDTEVKKLIKRKRRGLNQPPFMNQLPMRKEDRP